MSSSLSSESQLICNNNDDDDNDNDTHQDVLVSGHGDVKVFTAVGHTPFVSVNTKHHRRASAWKMTIIFMFHFRGYCSRHVPIVCSPNCPVLFLPKKEIINGHILFPNSVFSKTLLT